MLIGLESRHTVRAWDNRIVSGLYSVLDMSKMVIGIVRLGDIWAY